MGVRTSDQYVQMLKTLLPRGIAFPRDTDTVYHKFLQAVADELVRMDSRSGTDLFNEIDPSTANESIADWERVCGIPDGITQTTVAPTVAQREQDVLRKLTQEGGAFANLFVSIAAYFGYTVTIEETYPAVAGRAYAGYPCYANNWLFCFRVHAGNVITTWAQAGTALAGQPVQTWRNKILEAVINIIKPAHTFAVFVYG